MSQAIGAAIKRAREARGWSKAELARALEISASAVSQWESGKTTPELSRFFKIAEILEIDSNNRGVIASMITTREEAKKIFESLSETESSFVPRMYANKSNVAGDYTPKGHIFDALKGTARDVPVYGIAVGGTDGDFSFNGSEIDRALRPPALLNTKDVFALYVMNDSMYPAWREGALLFVNPNRTPSIGDDVVIEELDVPEGEYKRAYLKRLKARQGRKIIVEQFNPPKELEFDRDKVRLLRVIPWEEALGIS